jgi:endonuclease/exonuclease/phosphatase family metal-dependent hydrolase
MRLATFNVENMFERPKIMNLPQWSDGQAVLEDYARLNQLIGKADYTTADKAELCKILARHKGLVTTGKSTYLRLRTIRGDLIKQPKGKPMEVVAIGRQSWIGWFELEKESIREQATENTASVIKLVDADVLGVVEAENRIALKRFNEVVIPTIGGSPYHHVMLIDGNDDRGIDVGLMSRKSFVIESVRSHVDDRTDGGLLFSRDCPEYLLRLPSGKRLLLLVNHFKSKGYGEAVRSNARRKLQAQAVRKIYDARRHEGFKYIAVIGDLNDTPESDPLSPLLRQGSDLKDVSQHPAYQNDGRPGTHGNGTASGKLDYVLLSPALFAVVQQAGVERRGVWGGTHGDLWPHLPMKSAKDAASDHAALWVELAI